MKAANSWNSTVLAILGGAIAATSAPAQGPTYYGPGGPAPTRAYVVPGANPQVRVLPYGAYYYPVQPPARAVRRPFWGRRAPSRTFQPGYRAPTVPPPPPPMLGG